MTEAAFFNIDRPLHVSPGKNQIRAANFAGFSEFVRQRASNPRRIVENCGLEHNSILASEHHIDMKSFVDVFEQSAEFLNDRLFGLRLAQHQAADVFGCLTALCRAAPDFRTALENFIELVPVVHSPQTILDLVEGKAVAEFRYGANTDLGVTDQTKYQSVLLNLKLFQEIGGSDFKPSYVTLDVDASQKDIDEIEQALGCRFYKSPTNAIAFSTKYLSLPAVHSNSLVYELLRGYLDRVKSATRVSIVDRVEDYIRSALPSGTCSIARCAKWLGISERWLQLHLNEHGLRFSDMLEQQRSVLARHYLERDDHSLDDIAYMLGYSEQSSFGRAFKRWTNLTPQDYRAGGADRWVSNLYEKAAPGII